MGSKGKTISEYQTISAQKELASKILKKLETLPKETVLTPEDLLKLIDDKSEKDTVSYRTEEWDFTSEKSLECLIADEFISIRPFTDADKDIYQKICCEYSSFLKDSFKHEELRKDHWNKTQSRTSFFCIIEHLPDYMPIGYIALKDTGIRPWEIAIELERDYCHKGYGSRTIKLFLDKITEITWITEYQAIIEVDNIPSQKCFEKVGGKLVGIRKSRFIQDNAFIADFETQNSDLIDEHMISLADRLNIEPKTLLSHYLDYRIYTSVE